MNMQSHINHFYKRYKIEFYALISSLIITVSTAVYFSVNAETGVVSSANQSHIGEVVPVDSTDNPMKLVVDVSGAVISPGIYEVSSSTRLLTVVELAGGLAEQADSSYFYRNFNLARPLQDGEKIYIPYQSEVETGIFVEAPRVLRYMSSSQSESALQGTTGSRSTINSPAVQHSTTSSEGNLISINTASVSELDSLPGVGAKTVEKIIQNRPYSSLDELLEKKVIGQKLFETLQPQLSL
jgi:competence protein ComEA